MLTLEIGIVLAIILLVFALFVTEALPVSITALLGAVLLMVTGILGPEEGLAGFSNPATVTILAVFVLSAGLQRTGATRHMSDWFLKKAGKGSRRQVLTLGAITGPASGFLNNTAVVAMFIPAAIRLAGESDRSPSKVLIPLSFFAMTGGMLTIIGTSSNLLGNGLLLRLGIEPFGFFEFTVIGAVALGITLLYFLTFGLRMLPDRGTGNLVDPLDLSGFMAEFQVPAGAPIAEKQIREIDLSRKTGVQIIQHVRGDVVRAPIADRRLQVGDLLLVQGSRENLEKLGETTGLVPLPEVKHPLVQEDEDGEVATAEVLVPQGSRVDGKTLAGLRFNSRYGVQVLAVRHQRRVAVAPLSKVRLAAGDVLLAQGPSHALDRLEEDPDFVLTRERGRKQYRSDRLLVALAIMAGVVGLAAFDVLPIVTSALAGAVLMVMTGCLKMGEFIDSIQWDIVLLLAGAIPLGIALEQSGAAALLASGLGPVGGHLSPFWFLVLTFFLTSLLTAVVSNAASVVLLVPVAVTAAVSVDLDPRPFALCVILAASTSMITPVGYQTNTMVYTAGRYRFTDFTRVGAPLTLLLALAIPSMILVLFPPV